MHHMKKTDRARELRHFQTMAERKLWWALRSRSLSGYKFHRQYPIGLFIVDFCCRRMKLVIELDGGQHAGNQLYDYERTLHLEEQGYRVIRFWNYQVLFQPASVKRRILDALCEPGPLPMGEGGSRERAG